jgi:3-deoxy-D-arabino-heptulosonate 7-phosphate (DAHP) synthase
MLQFVQYISDIITWDAVHARRLQTQFMLERAREFGGLAF